MTGASQVQQKEREREREREKVNRIGIYISWYYALQGTWYMSTE